MKDMLNNISRNHGRYILMKAEPGSSDWWYEGSSDNKDDINERALQYKRAFNAWVWVIDTEKMDVSAGVWDD